MFRLYYFMIRYFSMISIFKILKTINSSGWIPWILNPWGIHEIQKVLKMTIYKAKLSQITQGIQENQGLHEIPRSQGFIAFFQQCLNFANSESLRNPRKLGRAESTEGVLGFVVFLWVLNFHGFLGLSDLDWLCK